MKLSKEKIKELKDRESEIDNAWDYERLACELVKLGDKEWAIKLFKKAEEVSENSSEFLSLANCISNNEWGIGDRDWARRLYKEILDKEEELDVIQDISSGVGDEDYFNDKKWAIEILQTTIKHLESADDFQYTAFQLALYGDKKSAIELFKKAEEKMDYLRGLLNLASQICNDESLGDKKWALKVYEKAEDLAESSNDIIELAKFKAEINDVEEVKELILKAIEIDDNIQGKINTVEYVDGYIMEDTEWINSLKPGIIKLVKDKYAKFEGYEFQFGLESWGKDLHSGEPTWITLIIKNGIPTITKVYLSTESVEIKENFHENDSILNFGLWPQSNDSDGLINVYDVIDPDSQVEYIEPVLNICIAQHSYDLMEVPTGEFSKYEPLSFLNQDGVLFLAEVLNLSLSKFFK
jgi:tetratricopeptide (TPR) repeat protein